VRHRFGDGVEHAKPLLAVLAALERIAARLFRKPEFVERESPRVGHDDPRRGGIAANGDMVDRAAEQQPFLLGERSWMGLVEAASRAGATSNST